MYDADARKSVMHAMAEVESIVVAYSIELVTMSSFEEAGER